MNIKMIILASIALSASVAFSQDAVQDFGDLVPGDRFSITQLKSRFREDFTDSSNYNMSATHKKDTFSYKPDGVKTPKKSDTFTLEVERAKDKKVKRITTKDYASSMDNKSGKQNLQTIKIGKDGKVDSLTNCFQDYEFTTYNEFGRPTTKNKSDFKCMTINKEVCSYMEKNHIGEYLLVAMNWCSEMFGKIKGYQKDLAKLSSGDNKTNLKALGLSGWLKSDPQNFYDISTDTLKGVSSVVHGYDRAISQCKYLEEKDYLRPIPEPEVKVEPGDSKDSEAKKE